MTKQAQKVTLQIKKHPRWATKFEQLWVSGVSHAFFLHFNVRDLVADPQISFNKYLASLLNGLQKHREKKLVVFYSRRGFDFATPNDEKLFLQIVGLAQAEEQAGQKAGRRLSAADIARQQAMRSVGNGTVELPADPGQAITLLDKALHQNRVAVSVVIEDANTIWPDADLSYMTPEDRTNLVRAIKWGTDLAIGQAGNLIIMTMTNLSGIHAELRAASAKYEAVMVELPHEAERLDFTRILIERNKQDVANRNQKAAERGSDQRFKVIEWGKGVTSEVFARITAGLSLIHLEDIFLRAAYSGTMTPDLVRERKATIMDQEYAGLIEPMELTHGYEAVGGLDHIKAGFQRSIIAPLTGEEDKFYRVPKGVLMAGAPGTGKSFIAVAVAKEAGINCFKFNVGKLLGKYVGQSEANLERALYAFLSMAPTIVFMDEIDQAIGRGESGDAGVGSRIFGRLLDFMAQEQLRGKVIFLGATNRPDLIDPAFKRTGRFDITAPFFVPGAKEREEIFHIVARKYRLLLNNDVDLSELVQVTEGYTPAEIDGLGRKARELLEDEELHPVEALQEASRRIFRTTQRVEWYTRLALASVSDRDWLSPELLEILNTPPPEDEDWSQEEEYTGRRARI